MIKYSNDGIKVLVMVVDREYAAGALCGNKSLFFLASADLNPTSLNYESFRSRSQSEELNDLLSMAYAVKKHKDEFSPEDLVSFTRLHDEINREVYEMLSYPSTLSLLDIGDANDDMDDTNYMDDMDDTSKNDRAPFHIRIKDDTVRIIKTWYERYKALDAIADEKIDKILGRQ